MRMFERDKDELRSFGINIETVDTGDDNGDPSGYRLDRKTFYLPYLTLSASAGSPASNPRRPDRYGYRALASLVVEPDELAIIVDAAARLKSLGDPVLSAEAESAMRKLSFDMPLPGAEEHPPASRSHADEEVFTELSDALSRGKSVEFQYHSMSSDTTAHRHAEPYGLFFLSGHWYLAARDTDRNDLRNFRLSRMSEVVVNSARSQTADYSIPDDFDLRAHARSRNAWEIGDAAGEDAIVEFRNPGGAARAASRLGVAVDGSGDRRRYRFRRVDSFARWLLSFGGEAIPVSPEALVKEFRTQAKATEKVYA
jgi:proteasome accessory factor B